jgi:hypothetical protein
MHCLARMPRAPLGREINQAVAIERNHPPDLDNLPQLRVRQTIVTAAGMGKISGGKPAQPELYDFRGGKIAQFRLSDFFLLDRVRA